MRLTDINLENIDRGLGTFNENVDLLNRMEGRSWQKGVTPDMARDMFGKGALAHKGAAVYGVNKAFGAVLGGAMLLGGGALKLAGRAAMALPRKLSPKVDQYLASAATEVASVGVSQAVRSGAGRTASMKAGGKLADAMAAETKALARPAAAMDWDAVKSTGINIAGKVFNKGQLLSAAAIPVATAGVMLGRGIGSLAPLAVNSSIPRDISNAYLGMNTTVAGRGIAYGGAIGWGAHTGVTESSRPTPEPIAYGTPKYQYYGDVANTDGLPFAMHNNRHG